MRARARSFREMEREVLNARARAVHMATGSGTWGWTKLFTGTNVQADPGTWRQCLRTFSLSLSFVAVEAAAAPADESECEGERSAPSRHRRR